MSDAKTPQTHPLITLNNLVQGWQEESSLVQVDRLVCLLIENQCEVTHVKAQGGIQ